MPGLRAACYAILLLLLPNLALADVGLPLIAVFLPPLWLGLVPIILVESIVNSKLLGVPLKKTLFPAALGNLISTIAGIPLTWVMLACIELTFFGDAKGITSLANKIYSVTIQSPWLIPYKKDLPWMIPVAIAFFMIPCFFVSVLIEAPVNQRCLSFLERRRVWKITAISNLASYAFMGILGGIALSFGDSFGNVGTLFSPLIEYAMRSVFSIVSIFLGS